MVEPAGTATAAPPDSRPPSDSRPPPDVQAQPQLLETVNALQGIMKQSEFQQPPTNDDSIANFRKLSDAFSAFQVCFAELQRHVDSVRTLIDSMRPSDTTNATPLSVSSLPSAAARALAPETEAEPCPESEPSEEEMEVKSPGSELKSTRSELESLCERMDGRGLRKYMTTHLADINGLIEEVPKALKLSRNPARLVLDCLGKFYLQGSRAYVKGSPVINGRKASILVLECFLLMGIDEGVEIEIEKGVKEEAEKAALAWRKRLIAEGGLRKAFDMDARGLLLLIGCFGIPGGFSNEDIRDLLLASPFKKNMSGALTRSSVFMAKITEIIEEMVNQKMEIEAVDIAYTFGIEDRFNPQKLMTSFLRESKEPLKKMKGKSQASLADVNEAKKHLSALRSVVKCSKRHSIDLSKLLPGWQINEQIMKLEKEIAVGEKKMVQKRKIDETESSGRISNKEAKQSHFPNSRLQQERVVNHINSNTTLLEGGTAGHVYGYSLSPSVLRGPGGHGRTLVDNTPMQIGSHTDQLHGPHADVAVYGRLPSHSYAYGPSSYLAGSTVLSNTKPGVAHRPPPYLEGGSRGLPNTIPTNVAGRSSASDPYQFDDTVTTSDLYRNRGLRVVNVVPSAASAHHSSYLYTGPDSFALGRHYFQP